MIAAGRSSGWKLRYLFGGDAGGATCEATSEVASFKTDNGDCVGGYGM